MRGSNVAAAMPRRTARTTGGNLGRHSRRSLAASVMLGVLVQALMIIMAVGAGCPGPKLAGMEIDPDSLDLTINAGETGHVHFAASIGING